LAGLAQIQKIDAMEIGGSASGGAVGTFNANATTGQPVGTPGGDVGRGTGGQTTIINMPPGAFVTRKAVRELLEMQNENSTDGSRTIGVDR